MLTEGASPDGISGGGVKGGGGVVKVCGGAAATRERYPGT